VHRRRPVWRHLIEPPWLSLPNIIRNQWLPPVDQQPVAKPMTLTAYANQWLPNRLVDGEPLKPRTREFYRGLLDKHILPTLGNLPVGSITPDDIRSWHAVTLTEAPALRAHAYSLLRTILNTAVTDQMLVANPATIRGAGNTRRVITIRPATTDELDKLVDAMPDHLKAIVLLAAWCALRFGELTELRRSDIDLEAGVVRVRRGVVRLKMGDENPTGFKVGPPKAISIRDVAIPPHLLPALRDHLVDHVVPGQDALLFPAKGGRHLAASTLKLAFFKARAAAGRPDLRFHDLRHTGAVLAASTGATLAELMARLGHSTVDASLRYQHVAEGSDQRIAATLSRLVTGTP
jgi:integrase